MPPAELEARVRQARRGPLFSSGVLPHVVAFGRPDLERLLPHRGSMLLLDDITHVDPVVGRLVGHRRIAADDPVFRGHFPDAPVYPGVLQVEMSGQLGLCVHHFLRVGAPLIPAGTGDQSKMVKDLVKDLENNIISGLVFVVSVLLFFLGVRTSSLVGVAHQGSYMQIGKAFEQLLGTLYARGQARPDMRMIGVYLDDPDLVSEEKLRSVACVDADAAAPAAAPLERRSISGGEYAVLRHKGPYAEMHMAYKWLYAEWLPRSGRHLRDALMFEEYLNNPRDVAPAELLTDIHMPLA